MRRFVRAVLTCFSFAQFFAAGLVLGGVVAPIVRLVTWKRERHRTVITRMLHRGYPFFLWWMRFARLIDYRRIELPPDVPRDRAFVLVTNHPSLIDTLFLLAWIGGYSPAW